MMFFKDNSSITIDCFTSSSVAYEYFPVTPSIEIKPTWWETLPTNFEVNESGTLRQKSATIKKCPGIFNLLKKGFMILNPAELSMEIKNIGGEFKFSYEFVGQNSRGHIDLHDHRQYLGVFNNKYLQAKITLPWLIQEKNGVEFLLSEPTWLMKDPLEYLIPPGILDFKYQNNINVNLFFELKESRIDISPGFPLTQLIPISDKKIKIKNHLISDEEYQKKFELSQPFGWISSYKKRKELINKKSKCPFRFL
jgi:hypothetical protein